MTFVVLVGGFARTNIWFIHPITHSFIHSWSFRLSFPPFALPKNGSASCYPPCTHSCTHFYSLASLIQHLLIHLSRHSASQLIVQIILWHISHYLHASIHPTKHTSISNSVAYSVLYCTVVYCISLSYLTISLTSFVPLTHDTPHSSYSLHPSIHPCPVLLILLFVV